MAHRSRAAVAVLGLMLFLASGCAYKTEPEPAEYQVKQTFDVEYGKVGDRPLLLHIAQPDPTPKKPMPVVIWLHGGGWMSGRSKYSPNPQLVKHGYFTVTVDYRLTDEAIFPAQIQDVKAAVRWLRANAKTYNIDPDRIAVWGHSAGGHLAALLGTSGGVAELEGDGGSAGQSSRVQAVVNLAGVIDLTKQPEPQDDPSTALGRLVGGAVKDKPDMVKQTNPITYITKDDPPVLTFHGQNDKVVPLSQSESLHEALQKAGVKSELALLPDRGHDIVGAASVPPVVEEQVLAFFDKYLKGKK
ncbi:MAG TPA: prolyl oligopeptidase family serine peptidase [Symbiobacteriaceae bacterium]|nr:prolyl oligopeptidase family serine peptidase [Symbiobacteriaceae bacterium]